MSRFLALRRRLLTALTLCRSRIAVARRQPAGIPDAVRHLETLEARILLDGNAAPVNSVPPDQTTQVNLPVMFNSAHGNLISISDADAGTNPVQVTLTASHGVISLLDPNLHGGLTYVEGDGNSDAEMTFTGTIDDINHALGWVVFRPDQDYVGNDASVTVTTSDLNAGVDGPGIDTDVIAVHVNAVAGTNQIFSVTDFGAAGDGTKDDAPAIRATIAAAIAAGGGTILFPPGDYRLDSFDPSFAQKAHFYLANCEGLRFSGYGAHLNSTSTVASDLFYLDGARRVEFDGFSIDGRFSRSSNVITQQSIAGFFITSTHRDSDGIRFADLNVADSYFFVRTYSDLTYSTRIRDVSVDNCSFVNGFYGLNLANNCDDFTCRGFVTQGLVRSYFVYGVDHHDVEYTSHGGDTFTDCVIKTFQRDTTDLIVKATVIGNTSHDAKLDFESQHDPLAQPVPGKIRNVLVDFDDSQSSGPKSARFAYFQTPGPIQTSFAALDLFENVIVRGIARNPTDFSVLQPYQVNIDTTSLRVSTMPSLNGATINENVPTGAVAGYARFPGDDEGRPPGTIYSLLDDAGGRFAVDPRTGLVFALRSALLNYENATSHDITVQALAPDGSTRVATFTIQVNDVNEFPISPIADSDPAPNLVPENSPNGTPVGITAAAVDQDGSHSRVTYSLTANSGGRFAIDPATGVVSVANSSMIDREAASAWSITVRAASEDGSVSMRSYTIQIQEVNEYSVSPITDADSRPNSVMENAANGTPVGITARASDRDYGAVVTYSLLDNAGGRFAIDAATGVVTVADGSLLDRELAATQTIVIQAASNDGSTSQQSFTIPIGDVNEFAISLIRDQDSAPNFVVENAPNGTQVGITASAVDLDATRSGVTYSLLADAGGRFAINSSTGVVTVANGKLLDREQASSWSISVLASSQDGSTSTQSYSVAIGDVNEFAIDPVADANAGANSVAEGAATGTPVGITARAIDRDATNSAVTYSLVNNAGGRFAIDPQTGIVTVANGSLIDRESAASHTIVVQAASSDGSSSQMPFVISVIDVNEYAVGPITNTAGRDPNTVTIPENSAAGLQVGISASAVDIDATNNRVTYSLTDSANGRFAIDPNTGVVTVGRSAILDRELSASFPITVQATSQDGSTSSRVFTINLSDLNDNPVSPINDSDAAPNQVLERADTGAVVGITAFATDPDVSNIGKPMVYSLIDNSGGRYKIDSATGVVTVANGLKIDYETATSNSITVKATSFDGSSQTRSFVIQVLDVPETATLALTNSSVAENVPADSVVGDFSILDAIPASPVLTFVSGAGSTNNSSFKIVNGQLRTSVPLNFEAASHLSIRVQLTSANGVTATQVFTIDVTDVNETPTGLTLSATSVAKDAPAGTVIGVLGGVDPDAGSTFNFSLVDGDGATDNSRVSIVGNQLVGNGPVTGSKLSIRVRVTDAFGLSFEKVLTIKVTKAASGGPANAGGSGTVRK